MMSSCLDIICCHSNIINIQLVGTFTVLKIFCKTRLLSGGIRLPSSLKIVFSLSMINHQMIYLLLLLFIELINQIQMISTRIKITRQNITPSKTVTHPKLRTER